MKTIYLAGGCFWGVESYFQHLKGVEDTEVGYLNSNKANPTYEEVCTGKTEAAEAVKVVFNDTILPFETLLDHFFQLIDPTLINRQGNDIGSQYRTGVYYIEVLDLPLIEGVVAKQQKMYERKIVTEVKRMDNFYFAEEYHQDYLKKNPHGYCHCLNEIEELKRSEFGKE